MNLRAIINKLITKVTTPSHIGRAGGESVVFLFLLTFSACSADTSDYDPYHHWQSRNLAWFKQVADSAHTAIATAQGQYGNAWEEHCAWRAIKSLRRSPSYQSGNVEDSIFVHIVERGTGTYSPIASDTVKINFRGTLMPTVDEDGNPVETIFAQTYYGGFDPATAAPQTASVDAFTEGFETALQYMVVGDDWLVYIPQAQLYGSSAQGVIPAYSAACFRINLVKVLPQRR